MQSNKGGRALPNLLMLLLAAIIVSGLVLYLSKSYSSARVSGASIETAHTFAGGTFEASGVAHVPGTNSILFVDDGRPSEVLWMQLDKDGMQAGSIKAVNLGITVDDPEGITTDGSYVYVIGSHSRSKGDKQASIARFKFNTETESVEQVQTISDLKRFLVENVAELRALASKKAKDDGINIEGLAWDPEEGHLLVGLRSPVIDGNAVLVRLKPRDPRGPFSYDNLAATGVEALRLPLGGLGIRSIEYDERQKIFHIIAGATESQDKVHFQLWEWGGKADNSRLREVTTFDRKLKPEGITHASIGGGNFKFVVFDTSKYLKLP
jgi:hypothetical protein